MIYYFVIVTGTWTGYGLKNDSKSIYFIFFSKEILYMNIIYFATGYGTATGRSTWTGYGTGWTLVTVGVATAKVYKRKQIVLIKIR